MTRGSCLRERRCGAFASSINSELALAGGIGGVKLARIFVALLLCRDVGNALALGLGSLGVKAAQDVGFCDRVRVSSGPGAAAGASIPVNFPMGSARAAFISNFTTFVVSTTAEGPSAAATPVPSVFAGSITTSIASSSTFTASEGTIVAANVAYASSATATASIVTASASAASATMCIRSATASDLSPCAEAISIAIAIASVSCESPSIIVDGAPGTVAGACVDSRAGGRSGVVCVVAGVTDVICASAAARTKALVGTQDGGPGILGWHSHGERSGVLS